MSGMAGASLYEKYFCLNAESGVYVSIDKGALNISNYFEAENNIYQQWVSKLALALRPLFDRLGDAGYIKEICNVTGEAFILQSGALSSGTARLLFYRSAGFTQDHFQNIVSIFSDVTATPHSEIEIGYGAYHTGQSLQVYADGTDGTATNTPQQEQSLRRRAIRTLQNYYQKRFPLQPTIDTEKLIVQAERDWPNKMVYIHINFNEHITFIPRDGRYFRAHRIVMDYADTVINQTALNPDESTVATADSSDNRQPEYHGFYPGLAFFNNETCFIDAALKKAGHVIINAETGFLPNNYSLMLSNGLHDLEIYRAVVIEEQHVYTIKIMYNHIPLELQPVTLGKSELFDKILSFTVTKTDGTLSRLHLENAWWA